MSTMTPEQARAILLAIPSTELSATHIRSRLEYIESEGEVREDGLRRIQLDGYFTADELEALAVWMRNPDAVGSAR
ncbi:hypothetical protein [Burkholderia ubonensis]|uniref:hypothetical protein n=1 Tax=Burkholderia ubonensis TaxID=101571 RepID=UPI000AD11659|nr:hypothetical protein [Burkholderia ubonensis]